MNSFAGIDAAHDPRGEQALKEAADPSGALPGGGDLHEGRAALRGDCGRRDQAGASIGFGEDAAWLGLSDLHPVLAGAPAARRPSP